MYPPKRYNAFLGHLPTVMSYFKLDSFVESYYLVETTFPQTTIMWILMAIRKPNNTCLQPTPSTTMNHSPPDATIKVKFLFIFQEKWSSEAASFLMNTLPQLSPCPCQFSESLENRKSSAMKIAAFNRWCHGFNVIQTTTIWQSL